jgi:hypothetical protein
MMTSLAWVVAIPFIPLEGFAQPFGQASAGTFLARCSGVLVLCTI